MATHSVRPLVAGPTEDRSTPEPAARQRRFAAGLRELRAASGPGLGDRVLVVIGGVLAPLGLVVVVLGWWGAANTPYQFEQVPYLISGGMLGLGLVFLGAFFYFTHWVTQLVKEQREQSRALLDAVEALRGEVASLNAGGTRRAPAPAADGAAPVLVTTARGALAHRPDCTAVVGKQGVRPVEASAAAALCKLCLPAGIS